MKDYLRQILERVRDPGLARCVVREYFQSRILESLQQSGAFSNWAFVGGTSLRFLYGLPRFSEDLDFSLAHAGEDDHFAERMTAVKRTLEAEEYRISVKVKTEKTVRSAFLKFERVLFELGLSPHRSETVSVKADIDANPPDGAVLDCRIIRKHGLLHVQHYDKSSLLAGKLHAILSRRYVKGRDMYDLMWYLSDRSWPGPNLIFLNHALRQTNWNGSDITETNWREQIAGRISNYDWDAVVRDVSPFLEKQSDLEMLTLENLLHLLENKHS